MTISLIILGALCFTSVVMAGALAIAWACFGWSRHAATWAAAFAVSAVQALLNALFFLIDAPEPLFALAFVLVAVPGPLVAIGVRQRARLATHWRWVLVSILVEGGFVFAASAIPSLDAIGFASAPAFSAVFLFAAAVTLRPRGRVAMPAEHVMVAALLLMAAVELATAVPTALNPLWPQESPVMRIYRAVLVLTIPPAEVCLGVAAILLVASDLAADLSRLASRDPLTGLLNRRGFQDAAVRTLANARRLGVPATLVLADIDRFKAINDQYGHAAGDQGLCFLSKILAQGVRQGDLVARIGGEEFAVVLLADVPATARNAIERVRQAAEAGYAFEATHVPLTASFGLASIPSDGDDLEANLTRALDRADRALYLSKIGGRNQVTLDG